MNEVTLSQLGSILPELILVLGGLLIVILDTFLGEEGERGSGFMAISVVFLLVALVGAALQFGIDEVRVLSLLTIDKFGAFMKIVIYAAMVLVAIAGGSYMNRRVAGRGEFWALFMFVTVAMSVAVSATNLLMIFLAIEFLSITSYLLVGFLREERRSTEAGVKYFLYGSVASSIMLYGMSFLYGASGSLNLTEISAAFATNPSVTTIVLPATVMVLVGLGFKTSLVPFHQWAPDTYEGAPTPITAYLSTASKAAGFAVMVRVLLTGISGYEVDWVPVLTGLAILTMTVGNLVAIRQSNVKRMLAYSSVAQAGYMLMGLIAVVTVDQADVSVLGMNGINGLLIYLFAYLFTNIGAFLVVMAVEESEGTADIAAFNGLAQRSPMLAWAMFVFMLSLTGIPLTGGFIAKFFVFGAAVQHQYWMLLAFAAINAGIAAFYYLNVVRAMFFPGASAGISAAASMYKAPAMRVPVPVALVVMICLVATLWLGIYPPNVIGWANSASQQLLTSIPVPPEAPVSGTP
ncbi:MAG: NADH-quinone oxidoreductase subunit N [Caldilineaceae bacterium]